jgi:hypothetical protein
MSIDQIKTTIGQLESSIDKVEDFLSDEDFKDYCDSIYTSITHLRVILKSVKQKQNQVEPYNS